MLSVAERSLALVSSEDLDPALVQEVQRESSGYTLDVLKDRLRQRRLLLRETSTLCQTVLPPTLPAMYLILM